MPQRVRAQGNCAQPGTAGASGELVVMGQVLAPFGVKGWIKIRPFTETVGALLAHRQWRVASPTNQDAWRVMELAEGHEHGSVLVARLESMVERTQAEELAGSQIAVARDELPAAAADEFYWTDLIGATVTNLQGVVLGTVSGLLETGAHAVLRVQDGRERLIPFVAAYVREVDLAGKTIRVDWQPDY